MNNRKIRKQKKKMKKIHTKSLQIFQHEENAGNGVNTFIKI